MVPALLTGLLYGLDDIENVLPAGLVTADPVLLGQQKNNGNMFWELDVPR